jgi:diguanylate cyclase (GGDEF)-like protein
VFGIIVLIVVNLAIGYALALYRYQPSRLPIRWDWLPSSWMPQPATSLGAMGVASPIAVPAASAPEVIPATIPNVPVIAPESPPPKIIPTVAPVVTEAAPAAASIDAPIGDANPSDEAPPQPISEAENEAVENAVMAFKSQLNRYCSQIGALDEKMREQSAAPQDAEVKACVEQFQELSSQYLEEQEKSVELLRTHATGNAAELARPCLEAAQQHSATVAATSAELTNVAALADAAAACREFLLGSGRVAQANKALNEEIDRTLDRVIQSETPADATPDSGDKLENAIREFVMIQASPGGKFSVALVEIDQLAGFNKRYGRGVSDRILSAVVQTFVALTPRSTVAKDPERQQFLFFQADTSARDTTKDVETVRQRIEAATFQHSDASLQATLSCSVAEATYEEEPAVIVQRLQEMLREAQRYGRNRTFFQEGEQSAPAIPPKVTVENRIIEI